MHAIMGFILLLAPTQTGDARLQNAQQRLEAYLRGMRVISIVYEEQAYLLEGRREKPIGQPRRIELLYQYPSLRHKVVEPVKDATGAESLAEMTTYVHRGRMTTVDHTLKLVTEHSSALAQFFSFLPFDAIGLRVTHTANTPLSDFLNCSDVVRIEGSTEINGVTAEVYVVGPGIPDRIRPSGWGPESTITMWLAPDYDHAPLRIEVAARIGETVRPVVTTAGSFDATEDLASGTITYFPRETTDQRRNSIIRFKVSQVALNPRITLGEFIPRIGDEFARAVDDQPVMIPRGKPAEPGVRDREEKMRQAELLRIEPPRAGKRFRWDIAISITGVLLGIGAVVLVVWIQRATF